MEYFNGEVVRPPVIGEGIGGITVGEKFNRLTAVRFIGTVVPRKYKLWVFRCDCGKEVTKIASTVKAGVVKSCGCLHVEKTIERSTRHGRSRTPEYQTWADMMARCYNPKNRNYCRYGERGIRVCAHWHHFPNFLEDMGLRPGSSYSIDRINNEGPYCKDNCRWATRETQVRNRSTNLRLRVNGEMTILKDFSKQFGCKADTVKRLLLGGYTAEDLLDLSGPNGLPRNLPIKQMLDPDIVFEPYNQRKDKLKMAQVTSIKELNKMIAELESPAATLSDDLALNAEPLVELYTSTLPVTKVGDVDYRFTLEDADALRQHDANFTELFGGIAGGLIADRAKADSEIGALDLTLDIGNAAFSTVFSRPVTENPTQKEWAASISYGFGSPKSKALEGKLRKEFAKSMMATDEEDEDDE
ncbi:hypothetical protein NP764_003986 [Salmonella enterica]|nr:hypothetical protein [Salmonella enterica]